MTELDFRLLFQAYPGRALALSPDLVIVAATDGYLRAASLSREALVGRNVFHTFPGGHGDSADGGIANLRASLRRALGEKRVDTITMPAMRASTPADASHGTQWTVTNAPVLDAAGAVAYVIHHVEAVTDTNLQLLDSAPDAMVVVGEDGRILLVNVQTEKLLGYARAELLGEHLEIMIPERFRRGHAGHLARYFANAGTREMGSGLELFARRKNGTEVLIEVSLSPLRTERGTTVSAAIRDISGRKAMEAAAKLLAERLASAVESIQDGFALYDDENRLVLCNSVYRCLLGESLAGPLVGRPYAELLDAWIADLCFADDAERDYFRAARLAPPPDQAVHADVVTRDGRSLRTMARRTPEGGIVETIWDLTEDVRGARELRHAQNAAEAASTAKSDFLSSMSHELRTPLNAILGFAQLLQRDKKEPLSPRHLGRVEHILKGGDHLLRLIDDILDLSRIEAGGISISTEPVGIPDVLEAVAQTLSPIAARQGIGLHIEALPHDLPMVSADRTRIAQILMNFGSNAIKYNRPSGNVTFRTSALDAERVRVTVSDTGAGISFASQEKLFQPFQRAGQETGPIEGTGIGLVISKRLAELMHGAVGFRSVPGEGSEFWVDLPAHASGALSTRVPVARAPGSSSLLQEGHNLVLYVEDNPANVTFMRDLVSSLDGVVLITAPTAEIGVELALARHPALVIMDINLPGMSGLDALRALRAAPETKDIPVIALTAATSDHDRRRNLQAGFDRHLAKPVKVDELLTALDELLTGGGD